MASPELDIYDSEGMFSSDKVARIYEESRTWPSEQKAAILAWLESAATRERIKRQYANAAEIAAAVDHDFRITPALATIADAIEQTLSKPRHNLLVTMPPQEGKSTLCAVWTPIRAWQLNPNRRVILASYGDDLAHTHSTNCRAVIEAHGTDVIDPMTGARVVDKLGLKLSTKSRRIDAWKIDGGKGGLVAVGLGSAITGRPADLFIIDDPYKNMQEADSMTHREKVDMWMASVAMTRLSPEASMILIQCMTGDTPVLRPDGTETPLRDIRAGDEIATYENGTLGVSKVVNWASQGYDSVYTITMMSGTEVRANARHPFLTVDEDGTETWVKLSELQPGHRLIAVHGSARPAPQTAATSQSPARVCACPTTTRHGGQAVTSSPLLTNAGIATYATATASASLTTTGSLMTRAVSAPSVQSHRDHTTRPRTGRESSAWITATTPERCEDCSATTATSPSGEGVPQNGCEPVPTIWTDTIQSIEPWGIDEVFDIQVERTENFIANGLATHNTRWHPEDLAGKVMAAEAELPKSQRTWRYLNIPAVSEEGVPDALGRKPGTVMVSARRRTKEEFEQTRRQVGERVWYALYQGLPTNPAGGLFERAWFDPPVEYPVNPVASVVAIDPADSGEGDETGIISAFLNPDGSIVFAHDDSELLTSEAWSTKAVERALSIGAREVALEGFATYKTYEAVVKHAYTNIHKKAREDLATGKKLTDIQQRALSPIPPFMVTKWTAGGDPVGRAAGLRQALETKRARVVPFEMSVFIEQAADWQVGQHCPDRVAAAVIAHDRLDKLGSGMSNYASPLHRGGRDTPSWLTRRISDGGGVGR